MIPLKRFNGSSIFSSSLCPPPFPHILGTCFVMVFASLLEYATVGYLGKRIAMRRTRCQQMAKLAEQRRHLEQMSGGPFGPGPYMGSTSAGLPYGASSYGNPFSMGPPTSRLQTPGPTTPHTPHYDKSCVSSPSEPTQQQHEFSLPIIKSVVSVHISIFPNLLPTYLYIYKYIIGI